jgi:hypothetical protein
MGTSPPRARPKRNPSPITNCFVLSAPMSTRSMKSSASKAASFASKRSTRSSSTPAAARPSALSRNRISRAGADAGSKYSFGWGSKQTTAVGSRSARLRSRNTARIDWCPRCRPSKLPIATARPGSAS